MYYPDNRHRLIEAFADQKGYLRSPGCSAIEMACVATGQAAAFICSSQKAHELGAAYIIVEQAGGVVVDWSGAPFAEKEYDFDSQYDVVVAASQDAADWILNLLHKGGAA
jgi:fructose-1,6-bisphosphatase/inositol monophosphatase family enzyme